MGANKCGGARGVSTSGEVLIRMFVLRSILLDANHSRICGYSIRRKLVVYHRTCLEMTI